jgi:hypothetical protein
VRGGELFATMPGARQPNSEAVQQHFAR